MADKTKTIKGATDKELNYLLFRLRQEYEALRLIRELKVKSISNPNSPYPTYTIPEGISTETLVTNGKSIKTMTDEELTSFINRLRNENEITRIILDIKEMNSPRDYRVENQEYEGVDMEKPIEDLYHQGVLGMKWGVVKAAGGVGAVAGKEGGKISDTARSGKEAKLQSIKKGEAKTMSDADLRNKINRLSMEQQYSQLAARDISSGRSKVADILSMTGSVLAISASVATAALAIKTLAG